jgi:hypothetical protein
MKKWPWKIIAMIVLPMVALLLWYGNRDDGTIKWSQFYNLNVELEHLGKPLNLHVVISCGSVGRQILGEGRSARSYWAPYVYGIEDQGHGVLVQTPSVCGADLTKTPMQSDYMPVMFWAPEAKNLEFMIAYLHEDAYVQPVSKLKFIKATVTNATPEEYAAWRKSGWKRNILPLADIYRDHRQGVDFFRQAPGANAKPFHPDGDVRNKASRFTCYSMIRLRLPDSHREYVRRFWPSDNPNYWLLGREHIKVRFGSFEDQSAIRMLSVRSVGENMSYNEGTFGAFSDALGVTRTATKLLEPTVAGHRLQYDAGVSHRLPFRSETGYPWATPRLTETKVNTLTFDSANGYNKGFGYCYRDVVKAFLGRLPLGERVVLETIPHTQHIVIDGQLIGTSMNVLATEVPHDIIVERDEFIWSNSNSTLGIERARNHQ